MTGLASMSQRELDRPEVLQRVRERRLTQTDAARLLGLTRRPVHRLPRACEAEGAASLASKRRGPPAPDRIAHPRTWMK